MGVKKGTNLFSKESLVESHLDDLRKHVIAEKVEVSSCKPTAMINGNAWSPWSVWRVDEGHGLAGGRKEAGVWPDVERKCMEAVVRPVSERRPWSDRMLSADTGQS